MADYASIMKDKTGYLKPDEINRMLEYAYDRIDSDFLGGLWMRNYLFLLILHRTGRRVSEIVGMKPFTKVKGLRPMDFHDDYLVEFDILKKNPIRIKNKSGQKRKQAVIDKLHFEKMPKRKLLPMDRWLYDMMQLYISHAKLEPHQRIFEITRQRADFIIKEIAKGSGVARDSCKIHAHHFRHTFAINFLKKNPNNPMALIHLKKYLDHSSIVVTESYTQFTPDDMRNPLEKAVDE